jgi:hypothetical protein
MPFHSTLLSRSSAKRAAVRFAGFGNRVIGGIIFTPVAMTMFKKVNQLVD